MALTAADDAPRVIVDDRKVLLAAGRKGIVEIVTESSWLVPGVLGITKEHTEEVASAGLALCSTIRFASMHDAQVVDELDVALLTVELGTETLCKLVNSVHSMHLLVRDAGHAGIAMNQGCTQEWRLHKLAHGLALREEEGWSQLKVRLLVPSSLLACCELSFSHSLTYFCFSSNGQSASAIVSKTSGSDSRSSL